LPIIIESNSRSIKEFLSKKERRNIEPLEEEADLLAQQKIGLELALSWFQITESVYTNEFLFIAKTY